jgi:hypothetical protein
MKAKIQHTALSLSLAIALLGLAACSSTRTENGVTIEQDRSYNPLNYIPGL